MPRITTLKFEVDNQPRQIHINYRSSDGYFRAEIPVDLREILHLEHLILGKTEYEVSGKILTAAREYDDAKITWRYEIGINYATKGYNNDPEAKFFFTHPERDRYNLGHWVKIKAVGFQYRLLAIKCQPGRKDLYYRAVVNEHGNLEPDTSFNGTSDKASNFTVLIPYNPDAHETLRRAEQTMMDLSRMIYNFIKQDPQAIEAQLTGGKFLTGPNQVEKS